MPLFLWLIRGNWKRETVNAGRSKMQNRGTPNWTRNSSGYEIVNVNFLYDDIVHILQNTIDSCIPPKMDAAVMCCKVFLPNSVNEITQCNGHYAVQSHSTSPMLVPIESSYTTSYYIILTYLLSCTVSKLRLIIRQIFASERGVPHFRDTV